MAAVPSFTRLCTLGQGSSATVSLASDPTSGCLVAVKSAELCLSSPLQHEHSILSGLSSPHIISCHGCYASGSQFNLILEFAPGGSLFDRIGSHTNGHLDEHGIRSYARDILLGLSYLHSNSISHGDIKSQNILIGSDDRAKIADFGAATQTGGTRDDKSGSLSGTPAFMAPEVARGEERGPEADIWALGCTIIEMATGKAPWHGIIRDQDVVAAVYWIGYRSDSTPDMPGWLSEDGKDFLSKCLNRDPKQRWSAERLLDHPYVRFCDTGSKRDGGSFPTSSPQSALDFGLVFHDSETEDEMEEEEEEEETGSNATARIRELAGIGSGSGLSDWDPNEEGGWVEVRSTNNGERNGDDGNGECESRNHAEFLDYGDDTDFVLSNLNFADDDSLLDSIYDSLDACTVDSNSKFVNSSFDQTMNAISVSSACFLFETYLFSSLSFI